MHRATKYSLFAVAFVIVAMAISVTPAPSLSQDGGGAAFTINHFEVYQNNNQNTNGKPVTLRDQFGESNHTLTTLDFASVPVSKNDEGINDPRAHLLWWNLGKTVGLSRRVVVRNQFGEFELVVGAPEYLLTPALKNAAAGTPLPVTHGHFKCYRIEGKTISREVVLSNQFGEHRSQALDPTYLCNPAEKQIDGQVHKIVKPNEHLVCYTIDTLVPKPVEATFRDQFSVWGTVLERPNLLCVPSTKEEVVQVEDASWGRMKSIYR
jgi:hypothetical protein